MSASLIIDLGAGANYRLSVTQGSGASFTVGEIVDLGNSDTYCNIWCAGGAGSGVIELQVQTSDSTASGTFTNPASGLAGLPSWMASGGVFFINSGLAVSGSQSLSAPVVSAPLFCSGGIQFGAFQRPHRYARLLQNSGVFPNYTAAGFVSQKMTVGSGGGFTFSPTSGVVNV